MSRESSLDRTSKFLSLVLRHKPEVIGVTIDKNGWANVEAILAGMNICRVTLDEIVRTDRKGRYEYNESGDKIRARQGHSVDVDVELEEKEPPSILYHGTAERFIEDILRDGIKSQSRKYVHLSENIGDAMVVGNRHGNPLVLEIDAVKMRVDDKKFYLSRNGVWLTKYIDKQYIKSIIHKAKDDTL